LRGSTVLVVGAGGIGRALIPMLAAFGADVIAVNRRGVAVAGARITVPAAELADAWKLTDHVVFSAPATEATRHMMGADQLAALKPTSWIVNVARGSLIESDALIAAVQTQAIAGAALDVTDPEPLPPNHAFWDEPRIVVTQHVANPPVLLRRALAEFVETNVRRHLAGQQPRGRIDLAEGY
jgi:phosphoglycerate dehydrogenase-like enzyme